MDYGVVRPTRSSIALKTLDAQVLWDPHAKSASHHRCRGHQERRVILWEKHQKDVKSWLCQGISGQARSERLLN